MFKRVLAGFVVLAVAGLALTSCGTVESGNVGVRTTLGKVNPEEVEPGLYLGVPGISRVQAITRLRLWGATQPPVSAMREARPRLRREHRPQGRSTPTCRAARA